MGFFKATLAPARDDATTRASRSLSPLADSREIPG